ncbi:MAG: hypothetical protein ABIT96_00425 [Ferruginibacter sp.]
MKKLQNIFGFVFGLIILSSCAKEDGIQSDTSFLNSVGSANYSKIFDISNDNSGKVKITPLGEGVSTFKVEYGQGTGSSASAIILPGESTTHAYPEGSYTVTITSYDLAGKATVNAYPLSLTYRAPENLNVNVGGDATVSATALYANSFLVYYGDVANEVGTPMAVGQTLPAHIYPSGGPYVLKVVALSGGVATTTYTKTLFGLPLTFEDPNMDYFFGTFGGVNFSKVANPLVAGLNTSSKVGKYEKPGGAEVWSGTYSPLNIPINLAQGKKLKMLVYNPSAANIGKKINVELEAAVANTGATNNGVAVLKIPITTSGAWEELVFDFSTIAAIGPNARFSQLVLRFNDIANGTGEIIYIDNIRLTN